MKKNYVIDTNVFLEDADCIRILRNGEENKVFIPETVLNELDKLKKDVKTRPYVSKAVEKLIEYKDEVTIISTTKKGFDSNDNKILQELVDAQIEDPVLVTNDKLFQFKAMKDGIFSEEFQRSKAYSSIEDIYTGIVEVGEKPIPNCFY